MSRNKAASDRAKLAREIEKAGNASKPVDIVDRLQSTSVLYGFTHPKTADLARDAANEIRCLRAEVSALLRRLDVSDEWQSMWRRSLRETNPEFEP